MTDTYFIGIDVSKANLDVFFHPQSTTRRYANTDAGRKGLVNDVLSLEGQGLVIFEASGGYEVLLRRDLARAGLPHACVQPARVHHYLKAQGCKAKTDRLDAKALALFGAAGLARPSQEPDETRQSLRTLTRTWMFLRKQEAALANQIEKTAQADACEILKKLLLDTRKQAEALKARIEAFLQENTMLQALVALLASLPGVGVHTARVLVAELPELGTCSKAEIAALTGTAPFTRQSGQWQGHAFITGGRHYARKALYMAALTASRFHPVFREDYKKLRAAGKPFKVALVAIMRKMVVTLNAMAKNNTPWQPSCS